MFVVYVEDDKNFHVCIREAGAKVLKKRYICKMNKHAYLILAHKNLSQLKLLLSLLDDERNDIFLHIDKKAPFSAGELEGCCHKSFVQFVRPIRITWGGVSIVKAEMELLAAATLTKHSYYHLISGLDLPIKSQDVIHDFFEANQGKEFLDLWEMPEHTLARVKYYTMFPEGSHFFLTNWLNHAGKFIFKSLGLEMNRGVDFRQGSQWFSITHGFAKYVVDSADWIDKVFSHSCICDEIFIPTVLRRSPYWDNLYDCGLSAGHENRCANMRHIDWTRGSSIRHPWTYTIEDFALLKESPCLWARKFDESVDARIIEKVATEL